jgi:hypothetical protein
MCILQLKKETMQKCTHSLIECICCSYATPLVPATDLSPANPSPPS